MDSETPIIRGIARVGTVMAQAHAQDFERKRRPRGDTGTVGVEGLERSPHFEGAMVGGDSSAEEDEEEEEDVGAWEADGEDGRGGVDGREGQSHNTPVHSGEETAHPPAHPGEGGPVERLRSEEQRLRSEEERQDVEDARAEERDMLSVQDVIERRRSAVE